MSRDSRYSRLLAGLLSVSIGVVSFPVQALAGPGIGFSPKVSPAASLGNGASAGAAALQAAPAAGLAQLPGVNLSLSLQGTLPVLAPVNPENAALTPAAANAVAPSAPAPAAANSKAAPAAVESVPSPIAPRRHLPAAAPKTVSQSLPRKASAAFKRSLPQLEKTGLQTLRKTVAEIERGASPAASLDQMYQETRQGNGADLSPAMALPWGPSRSGLHYFSEAARAAVQFVSVPQPSSETANKSPRPKGPGRRILLILASAVLTAAIAAPIIGPGLTPVAAWNAAANFGYYAANVGAFLYPLPQIFTLFKNRSGRVSTLGLGIGVVSSLLLAFNAAFAVKGFWVAQNLFGVLGLGVSFALVKWFQKHPLTPEQRAARRARKGLDKGAVFKSLAVIGGMIPLTLLIGWTLMQVLPMVAAAGSLIVPFQIVASLGFAYLLFPQLVQIEVNKDPGDTSLSMAALYLLANGGLLIWALREAALLAGPLGGGLLGSLAFTGIITAFARWQLPKLAKRDWHRLPSSLRLGPIRVSHKTLVSLAGFLSVGTLMAITTGLGLVAMVALGGWPTVGVNQYLMYMLYAASNIFGALISVQTLKAISQNRKPASGPAPPTQR